MTKDKVISYEEAAAAMSAYADAENKLTALELKKKSALLKLEESFKSDLEQLAAARDEAGALVLEYAEQNKDSLFDERRKTAPLGIGKVSMRENPPALTLLPEWTWDKVLYQVETYYPSFLRVKKEIDKKAIIEDLKKRNMEEWPVAGVIITRETTLSIKL